MWGHCWQEDFCIGSLDSHRSDMACSPYSHGHRSPHSTGQRKFPLLRFWVVGSPGRKSSSKKVIYIVRTIKMLSWFHETEM